MPAATPRTRAAVGALSVLAVGGLAVALVGPAGPASAAPQHAVARAGSYAIGSAVQTKLVSRKPSPTPAKTTATPSPTPTKSTATPTPTPAASSPTATPTTTTSAAAPAGTTATQQPATGCGGESPVSVTGSPLTCTFDDEFDGTSVDRDKWTVQTTAASGFHSGAECFVDSPNNLAVSGGTLKLTVRQEAAPFTCASPLGSYSTQYTSGSVNGYGKFAQTYGQFEVRAKLPATTIKGLQETLWLWPVNSTKYGTWPSSGEIDLGEFYSQYAGWNIPYIHYDYLQSTVNWSTNTNVYTALPAPYAQPGMNCTYNQADFNTYTVLWEPGRITLRVNGQNCIVDNYSATNVSSPAPFDQPFFMALTQGLGIGDNAFVPGTTPLPATTEVDYVRIWQ